MDEEEDVDDLSCFDYDEELVELRFRVVQNCSMFLGSSNHHLKFVHRMLAA